jgi:hypothetical protein
VTHYLVFLRVPDPDRSSVWSQFTAVEARSAQAAIRAALGGEGHDNPMGPGEYAAVPLRSWRPVSVTVQTETKIRIG